AIGCSAVRQPSLRFEDADLGGLVAVAGDGQEKDLQCTTDSQIGYFDGAVAETLPLVDVLYIGVADFRLGAVTKIIKQRDTVGFRPEADFARLLESIILPSQGLLAIISHNVIIV